jgi:hypothetical protein
MASLIILCKLQNTYMRVELMASRFLESCLNHSTTRFHLQFTKCPLHLSKTVLHVYNVPVYGVCAYNLCVYRVCTYGVCAYGVHAYRVHTAYRHLWFKKAFVHKYRVHEYGKHEYGVHMAYIRVQNICL